MTDNMHDLNSVALRIRQTRVSLGLIQEDFGKKLGCCKSTVINYESGKRVPDARFLIDLAKKFNISIDWLLMGRGDMKGQFPFYNIKGHTDKDLHGLLEHMQIPTMKMAILAEYHRLQKIFKPLIDEFEELKGKR